MTHSSASWPFNTVYRSPTLNPISLVAHNFEPAIAVYYFTSTNGDAPALLCHSHHGAPNSRNCLSPSRRRRFLLEPKRQRTMFPPMQDLAPPESPPVPFSVIIQTRFNQEIIPICSVGLWSVILGSNPVLHLHWMSGRWKSVRM
jgi:hypothetical protein